jgi:hypothetical protein
LNILLSHAFETEIKPDILKKRNLANNHTLGNDKREQRLISEKISQEKKETEMSFDSTVRSRQFEKILRPSCFSHHFLVSFL